MLRGTLLPGLPEGLDHAAEADLCADLNSGALPAGRLVIERAGYDQESSLVLFATAAELLPHILLAGAFGSPAEPIIRSWAATGRIPVALLRVLARRCRPPGRRHPQEWIVHYRL
ncbi:hypothetical protein ACH4CE_13515 [Streptomyces gelaticus]|uniref:hypothetical protein n=1 Tax=Streptomyces gelaticus TaxID=285446 RepID=UPI0037B324B0